MAKGSHTGWNGLAREKRFCAVCGVKVTLKDHLWVEEFPVWRVFHHRCRVEAGEVQSDQSSLATLETLHIDGCTLPGDHAGRCNVN